MIVRILLGALIGAGVGSLLGYFGKCSSGTCPLTANPYRGAMYGLVMGIMFALALPRAPKAQSQNSGPQEPGETVVAGSVEETPRYIKSESDFKTRVLDAKAICLVDLFSDSCPPCRALAPTVVSLAKRYAGRVGVFKVDVSSLLTVAERYGIRGVPTVLVIKNGKEVKRLVGLRREAQYVRVLDKLLERSTQ